MFDGLIEEFTQKITHASWFLYVTVGYVGVEASAKFTKIKPVNSTI